MKILNQYIKFSITLLLIVVLMFFSKNTLAQSDSAKSIYSTSVFGIDGNRQSMASFKGKKIWIIVLPDSLSAADIPLINLIDSVAKMNNTSLQTIIVPSLSAGGLAYDSRINFGKYCSQLKQDGILIASPAKTKKANRPAQKDNLLNWLADPNRNGRLAKEPDGNGTVYLVDTQGNIKSAIDLAYISNNNILNTIFQ